MGGAAHHWLFAIQKDTSKYENSKELTRPRCACCTLFACLSNYDFFTFVVLSQRRLRSKPLPAKLLGALPSTLNKAADLAYEVEQEVRCIALRVVPRLNGECNTSMMKKEPSVLYVVTFGMFQITNLVNNLGAGEIRTRWKPGEQALEAIRRLAPTGEGFKLALGRQPQKTRRKAVGGINCERYSSWCSISSQFELFG